MEAFIRFLIQHNEKIVYISGGVLCLLSAFVVWWQVFGRKGLNTDDAPQVDLSGIEASLKKILSSTNLAMQNVNAGGGAATGASTEEVVKLKQELESRQQLVAELTTQVEKAKSADPSAELLAKIKTLEGKLAEYEIIEDDIADLSNFKEENARLKKELDTLKRGGPQLVDQFADALTQTAAPTAATAATAAAPAAPAAAAPAAAAPKATVADAVAQAQASLGMVEAAVATTPAEAEEEILDFSTPDVSSVNVSSSNVSTSETTASAAAEMVTPAAAPAEAAAAGDIFGEFSSDENADDPLAALGDIDPDKMLDELKDLNADLSLGAEALDEAPDIDKLAEEAQKLENKG